MIHMAEDLVKKGKAYEAGGDVYFDVSASKDYGKLGKKTLKICSRESANWFVLRTN